MLNKNFYKYNLKSNLIMASIYIVVLAAILIPTFFYKSFSQSLHITDGSGVGGIGIGSQVNLSIAFPIVIVLTVMYLVMQIQIFSNEIKDGTIGSWMVLPMSRKKIMLTKLLTIYTYIFLYWALSFAVQLIVYPITTFDFSNKIMFRLIYVNLGILFTTVLNAAILFLIASFINNSILSKTISILFLSIVSATYLVSQIGELLNNWTQYLKYISTFSFLPNIFKYDLSTTIFLDTSWNLVDKPVKEYYEVNPLVGSVSQVYLKLPISLIVGASLSTWAFINFKNKSFSI